MLEPVIVPYPGEPATETFLSVLEAGPGQRLITVIEILSLANKLAGPGQRQYRQKQHGVSLVEIDLLRQGRRILNVPTSHIPAQGADHLSGVRAPGMAAGAVRGLPRAAPAPAATDPHPPAP